MDDNYQSYVNRVTKKTLPNNYLQQLKNIQTSSKFVDGKPVNFPGYTIITPPWEEETHNNLFYEQLKSIKEQLTENLAEKFFIPIPEKSFHFTIADLIWEQDYLNAIAKNPDFDQQIIQEINLIFNNHQSSLINLKSLELELLGLSIFPRAIAVCLAPLESSYEVITNLRRDIYQNKKIKKLGIEQQYDFIAHITLGYFGEINPETNMNNIANILTAINDQWLENHPPNFKINQIELRKFENMMSYQRQDDWAILKL